ncbi:hypothetical protein RSAG8_07034, partial [Rhizoctonia solani AG-8 WAC10335]
MTDLDGTLSIDVGIYINFYTSSIIAMTVTQASTGA